MSSFWNFIGLASYSDIENIRKQQVENENKLDSVQETVNKLACALDKLEELLCQTVAQQSNDIKLEFENTHIENANLLNQASLDFDTLNRKVALIVKQNKSSLCLYKDNVKRMIESNSHQEELLRILIANCLVDSLEKKLNVEE
ncbi:MAG: hypothetical protein RSD33_10260 [Clostridium sp.]